MRPLLFLFAMTLQNIITTSEIGKQNYARTPFTGSTVASTGIVQAVSAMEATVEKRDNSQLQLSLQRNEILRGDRPLVCRVHLRRQHVKLKYVIDSNIYRI